MPSLPSLLVRDFLPSKYCTHTRLQIYFDSLQHGAWTSGHSRLFFTGHQGGFVQLGVPLPILHDTTYLQVFLLLHGHGLLVFFEDAFSILDLSVLVLAGNFGSKCHSGNSSFHHLLEHDLLPLVVSPRSFPLATIGQRFLPLIGSLR